MGGGEIVHLILPFCPYRNWRQAHMHSIHQCPGPTRGSLVRQTLLKAGEGVARETT